MPSASPPRPSPAKPSLQARSASTYSLSSSGKPGAGNAAAAGNALKPQRPHLVSRPSRNVSYSRGSTQSHAHANMPKKSMAQVYGEARHHKRNKSGTATPSASPKATTAAHIKRNASHVVLPKNRSAGNLRKNQSASTLTALHRNLSRGALNKLGAPAEQKARQEQQQKQGVFDLGNASSEEEEEEAEWEDSTASPDLTRDNSKVPTPARSHTPNSNSNSKSISNSNGEPIQKPPEQPPDPDLPEKTSSPPEPSIMKNNKSAPNLRKVNERSFSQDRPRQDPALLQPNGRSRAPPAMTTATARPSQQNLNRNESQRSLRQSNRRTSLDTSQESAQRDTTPKTSNTPTTPGLGAASSGSAGVSHFLTNDQSLPRTNKDHQDSETDESVSDFMATYKPQPSQSPEKPRTNINRARLATQPSRTQQKLELQRREVMRGGGPPPSASAGMALSVGSSISVHSRSASKGRTRSMAGEYKAIKQDYENAVKQLTVVRRFRNPVLESLTRIKQTGGVLPNGTGDQPATRPAKPDQKRPLSRHGRTPSAAPALAATNVADRDPTKQVAFRPSAHRDSRVSFQLSRQGSHDDILTTSAGSPEAHQHDLDDGLSPNEALIRRMWESRIHAA